MRPQSMWMTHHCIFYSPPPSRPEIVNTQHLCFLMQRTKLSYYLAICKDDEKHGTRTCGVVGIYAMFRIWEPIYCIVPVISGNNDEIGMSESGKLGAVTPARCKRGWNVAVKSAEVNGWPAKCRRKTAAWQLESYQSRTLVKRCFPSDVAPAGNCNHCRFQMAAAVKYGTIMVLHRRYLLWRHLVRFVLIVTHWGHPSSRCRVL